MPDEDELIDGVPYRSFVDAAAPCRTEEEFRRSPFFAEHGAELLSLLSTPRVERFSTESITSALPNTLTNANTNTNADTNEEVAGERTGRAPDVLRIIQWNIEKGKRLEGLRARFRTDPLLRAADVVCLNEVDVGMLRAGPNADVARELAEVLGMNSVYLPSYIECTKGVGDERRQPGENRRGLHGLAVLSRWPVRAVRMRALPPCWDYFDFFEKRFGFRQGLYVLLDWAGRDVAVATTHLEVRRTPNCRARQFGAVLDGLLRALEDWGHPPVLITGDWNTSSFPRGGLLNSARGFVRVVQTPRAQLDAELAHPELREPLFEHLARAGFAWQPFNDFAPTASQQLGTVEDLTAIPAPVARLLMRASGLSGRVLHLRLDWMAARGFRAAAPPQTLLPTPIDPRDPEPLSDHALLLADVRLS